MKILLVHKFHRLTGGAEVFYFEVGRVLKESGHDVAYFSTLDDETLETPYKKYFSEAPNFKTSKRVDQIKAFLKVPYNFEAKKKFTSLILDFKPDIIHAFGVITQISPSIFDAAKKYNIPIIVSLNDYKHICPISKMFHHGKVCEDCKGNRFYKAVINKCSHDSHSYSIASSIESYVHYALNIYKKNISLFLFASNFMKLKTEEFWGEDSFVSGELKNPFKFSNREIEMERGNYGVYFGRLSEEKGVNLILEALTNREDLPFKIIGEGPLLIELKTITTNNKLTNIEFLGPLWGEDLEDILYKARYVVVPSVWYENFPYVILQSFAAGIPVIGSNLGGIPELVTKDRGILFDVNNLDSLINAIDTLNVDDENYWEMSKNAREFIVKEFNDNNFYNNIMYNYKRVLTKTS